MKKTLLAGLAIVLFIPVISFATTKIRVRNETTDLNAPQTMANVEPLEISDSINQKIDPDNEMINLVSESTVSKFKSLPLEDLIWLRDKLNTTIAEIQGEDRSVTPLTQEKSVNYPDNSTEGKILLTGTVDGATARLKWSVQNMASPEVYKLFYSTKENPTEFTASPESELRSVAKRFSSEDWDLYPGTYYFRVCEWIGYKCGIYSNNVKIVIGDGKNVDVSPRTRGKVRIIVKSSATKLPVAGIPVVIEHSGGKKTNLEGWVEFNQSDGNAYVAGGKGFHSSEVVNTMNGDEKGIITIYIKPPTNE